MRIFFFSILVLGQALAMAQLVTNTMDSSKPVGTSPTNEATSASTATAESGPVPTLRVGGKTFENVTLSGFDGKDVTFSHSAGIKTVPLLTLTAQQVEDLNRSTDKVTIEVVGVDLTPPSPEAVKTAETLIEEANGVDGLLPNGNTPLIEAVATKRPEVAKALIARGAKVNLENQSGKSALSVAEGWGDAILIRMLTNAGAEHRDEVITVTKTSNMLSYEKKIQEYGVKLKKAEAEAKSHGDKAAALRRSAASLTRSGLGNPIQAEQNKKKAGQLSADAAREESKAKAALSQAARHENEVKRYQQYWEGERQAEVKKVELQRQREERQRLAEEQAAMESDTAAEASADIKPPRVQVPSGSDVAEVDPESRGMQEQMRQMQAGAQTAQSMVDIMQSKTAAEKEVERLVQETKEKMAKVPAYVKYVVWVGIMFLTLGVVWFIGLAFYESMGWGLVVFFTGPIGAIIYFILHPKETWIPFALWMFGLLMCWIPIVVYQVGLFDFLF